MISRPLTLAQVAERTDSMDAFGRHLRDWLHELRRMSSRGQVKATILEQPRILRRRFPDGAVADAWLAAYAEHLARRIETLPPTWAFARARVAPQPWFANESGSLTSRIIALQCTPLSFKRRNLYTPSVELLLGLRTGRPAKSPADKRLANARRQRRFRERRKAELVALRQIATRSQ